MTRLSIGRWHLLAWLSIGRWYLLPWVLLRLRLHVAMLGLLHKIALVLLGRRHLAGGLLTSRERRRRILLTWLLYKLVVAVCSRLLLEALGRRILREVAQTLNQIILLKFTRYLIVIDAINISNKI